MHRIGSPRLVHMSSRSSSSSFVGKNSFMNNAPEKDDISIVNDWRVCFLSSFISIPKNFCFLIELFDQRNAI